MSRDAEGAGRLTSAGVNDQVGLDWHADGRRVLLGTTSGSIWELELPDAAADDSALDAGETVGVRNKRVIRTAAVPAQRRLLQGGHSAAISGLAASSAAAAEPEAESDSGGVTSEPYFAAACEDGHVYLRSGDRVLRKLPITRPPSADSHHHPGIMADELAHVSQVWHTIYSHPSDIRMFGSLFSVLPC